MTDFKPKPGSFTAYLEYAQRHTPPRSHASVSPLTLLEILAREGQRAVPLAELEALSGMEPSRFREALKSLRDASYIMIAGPALEEVVRLADKGAEVVQLARPA